MVNDKKTIEKIKKQIKNINKMTLEELINRIEEDKKIPIRRKK